MAEGLGGRADGGHGVYGVDEIDHKVVVNFTEASSVSKRETEVKNNMAEVLVDINWRFASSALLKDGRDEFA